MQDLKYHFIEELPSITKEEVKELSVLIKRNDVGEEIQDPRSREHLCLDANHREVGVEDSHVFRNEFVYD